MQEDIYSDIWGETLYKKDVGKRVYIYNRTNRNNPTLILDNDLMIDKMINFLKRAKKEKYEDDKK